MTCFTYILVFCPGYCFSLPGRKLRTINAMMNISCLKIMLNFSDKSQWTSSLLLLTLCMYNIDIIYIHQQSQLMTNIFTWKNGKGYTFFNVLGSDKCRVKIMMLVFTVFSWWNVHFWGKYFNRISEQNFQGSPNHYILLQRYAFLFFVWNLS